MQFIEEEENGALKSSRRIAVERKKKDLLHTMHRSEK